MIVTAGKSVKKHAVRKNAARSLKRNAVRRITAAKMKIRNRDLAAFTVY